MDLNKNVRNLDAIDYGEVKWASVIFGILLVKFFPIVATLPWYMYVILFILLIIRPAKHFLSRAK